MARRPGPGSQARGHQLDLQVLPDTYAICRLPTGRPVDRDADDFLMIVRSRREIEGTSVICLEREVPDDWERDGGWHVIRLDGVFGFGEVGVLSAVLGPLAEAGVPTLATCSFETDYVLVKAARLDRVRQVLEDAGHRFVDIA